MPKLHEQCHLAKSQLYLHSSGKVYPCGFLQGKRSIGSVKEKGIRGTWYSEDAKQFRDEHLQGVCADCSEMQEKYNCHLLHPNIIAEEEKLRRLDIMIDSFCNLECVMCTNRSEENKGFVDDDFWNELETDVLKEIEEIELVGGEPFIIRDTYKLIDLVKKVNPSIRWCFTTNGHFDFDKLLANRLKGLNIYSFAVSIDSFDKKKFAEIRVNGDLDKAKETIIKIEKVKRDLSMDFYLSCNFLIQQDNYGELESAFKFQEETGIPVYFILLREPVQFSILSFDEQKLVPIVRSYLYLAKKYNSIKLLNTAIKITKEMNKVGQFDLLEDIVEGQRALGIA